MNLLKRYALLALAIGSSFSLAQTLPSTARPDPMLSVYTPVPLWPGGAPGAVGKTEADTPTVSVYLPAINPTRTAVVVAPGGGYRELAMDHEGAQVAQWLNAHGVAALVLRYRLGPVYHHPIELGDGQRAVRYARAHAAEMGVDPRHIGFWGFSAGGHLAASVGTHFDAGSASAGDAVDREPSRPDFLILAYPVITMQTGVTHPGSQTNLLGDNPDPALIEEMSAEKKVTPQTPPTFLFSTSDDNVVPIANSVLFYQALIANHVPAEMHIFRHGAHGLGLAQADPVLSTWTDLLYTWMRSNGWAR